MSIPDDGDDQHAFVSADEVARVISLSDADAPAGASADSDVDDDADAHPSSSLIDALTAEDDSVQGFFAHSKSVFCAACHGPLVVTGDEDNAAYVWDMTDGSQRFALSGHADSVTSCGFSADGSLIATGSMDSTVRVWRARDGSLLHTLEGCSGDVEWLAFHPSGPVLLVGSADSTVWMWNLTSGQCMHVLTGHAAAVLCGSFSADGKLIITGDESGEVIIWAPKTGSVLHRHKDAHDGPCTRLAVHPTQRIAVTGGVDGVVKVWSLETGKRLSQLAGHEESVEGVSFCAAPGAGHLLASGAVDGGLVVWDLNTRQQRLKCAHPEAVTAVQFDAAVAQVYTACMDGLVRCWDALTGDLLAAFHGHSSAVLCLAVAVASSATSERKIVSGSDDGTCLVFDWNTATRSKGKEPAHGDRGGEDQSADGSEELAASARSERGSVADDAKMDDRKQ